MDKLKTFKDFKTLNYKDVMFVFGVNTTDAMRHFVPLHLMHDFTNKKFKPSINDVLPIEQFLEKYMSCTTLEGIEKVEFLIKTYNTGVPTMTLAKYSWNKAFMKAMKFTGASAILNDILNRDQLRFLQEYWLYKNCYKKVHWFVTTKFFIYENDWAEDFLKAKGITVIESNRLTLKEKYRKKL